jgi:hypothetical protein
MNKKGEVSQEIIELTTKKFTLLLKQSGTRKTRDIYLQRCLENIQNGIASNSSMGIIKNVIDYLPLATNISGNITKSECVTNLFKEFNIIGVILINLGIFKNGIKE